ncbi:tRNA (guanine(46)-N(7))-methyltransferase TrmB [Aliidiomarina indica]|uniref:tRNA (guanine(46)-N(7))-methyltransferase TrmB n=1 Tax=Aliidiomarina indica TaxID=2749147 RepID=UPI00188F30A5|nr:methyltransferase domain-containing protein [Aliidiomarina indica]
MSEQLSRAISSNQEGPHSDVPGLVARYWQNPFRKPIAEHSAAAFAEAASIVDTFHGPIILDACCGVGESTATLARRYPEALVIGVDKSAHRLGKHTAHSSSADVGRYVLVRADLNDFWRLAADAQWQPTHQFLMYPNPWPKKKHLGRRWHGSPVFPSMVKLGGNFELRSNWSVYLQEMSLALAALSVDSAMEQLPDDLAPITPFERKYQASGQALWRLQAHLEHPQLVEPSQLDELRKLAEATADMLKSSARKNEARR